jgi:hypothetical protein
MSRAQARLAEPSETSRYASTVPIETDNRSSAVSLASHYCTRRSIARGAPRTRDVGGERRQPVGGREHLEVPLQHGVHSREVDDRPCARGIPVLRKCTTSRKIQGRPRAARPITSPSAPVPVSVLVACRQADHCNTDPQVGRTGQWLLDLQRASERRRPGESASTGPSPCGACPNRQISRCRHLRFAPTE